MGLEGLAEKGDGEGDGHGGTEVRFAGDGSQVDMGVDEARGEEFAGAIDVSRILDGGCGGLVFLLLRGCGDGGDLAAGEMDGAIGKDGAGDGIYDADVLEDICLGRW